MQTWKKVVIISSITIVVGVGIYYVVQSQRIKKIKDRGFIINVSKVQDEKPAAPTWPDNDEGIESDTVPALSVATEFANIFSNLFKLN